MYSFIKNNKFNLSVALIWLVIGFCTVFFHELWRDEANVWCIVRDYDITNIIRNCRTEGHPLLWYLILVPFAKSGFSVFSMQIISLFAVFIAVVVFLFKIPCNKFEKIVTVFSAGMIYYLPVVARNYALIPLSLFLIAFLWNKKNIHPFWFTGLIILLSNTHIYMEGLAFGISCIFAAETIKKYREDKNIKILVPLGTVVLNFLLLFLMFYHSPEQNYAILTKSEKIMPVNELFFVLRRIFIFPAVSHIPFLIKYSKIIEFITFFIPYAFILYGFYKSDKKIFALYVFSVVYILSVFAVFWFRGIIYQKAYLIVLITLFCYLILKEKNKIIQVPLYFILSVSCICSFYCISDEIKYNFSTGKRIAEYINKNLPEETTFIAFGNPYLYTSISAYMPDKKLYSPYINSYITQYSYNAITQPEEFDFPENVPYFIADDGDYDFENLGLKVIYAADGKVLSSDYPKEAFKICKKFKEI